MDTLPLFSRQLDRRACRAGYRSGNLLIFGDNARDASETFRQIYVSAKDVSFKRYPFFPPRPLGVAQFRSAQIFRVFGRLESNMYRI